MWTCRKSEGYPVSSLRVPSRSRNTALRVFMACVRLGRRPPSSGQDDDLPDLPSVLASVFGAAAGSDFGLAAGLSSFLAGSLSPFEGSAAWPAGVEFFLA